MRGVDLTYSMFIVCFVFCVWKEVSTFGERGSFLYLNVYLYYLTYKSFNTHKHFNVGSGMCSGGKSKGGGDGGRLHVGGEQKVENNEIMK